MTENNELSEREIEILKLVATGASNKEIAYKLSISPNTVKVHLKNIFAKIEVVSRTEAAMYAVKRGWVGDVGQGITIAETQEVISDQLPNVNRSNAFIRWFLVILISLLLGVLFLYQTFQGPAKNAKANTSPTVEPNRWQELKSMPTARSGLAVAVYENQIYAIGGETPKGVTGVVERYDIETDTWDTLPSKPVPVTDIQAAVIGGKIYVPGGKLSSGSPTNIMEIYEPSKNLWKEGPSLPIPTCGYGLVAFEGKLFLFGGWDGQKYLNTVFEYNIDQDKWLERKSMLTGRAYLGATIAGGRIYVLGGFDGRSSLTDNDEYIPENDSWTARLSLPEGRYAMGTTSIADIVYVIGGIKSNENTVLSPLQYIHQLDKWQEFQSPIMEQWYSLALVPYQTRLYGIGGKEGKSYSKINVSFQAIYTILIPIIP